MKKRILSMVFALVSSAMLLTSCGSSSSNSKGSYDSAPAAAAESAMVERSTAGAYADAMNSYDNVEYEEAYEPEGAGYESGSSGLSSDIEVKADNNAVNSNRKLIRTVNLTAETLEYEPLMMKIKSRVSELGGYFENLNETRNSYGNHIRYASMIIRIPKDKADDLITTVENESNITNRDDSTNDVTLDYVDMESHKKTLQTEQKRLLELLEKAETIEDIITLESRISDVRYQIESMESKLRSYDNKIDYTTVYLDVREVEEITPEEEPTFGQRIREGLNESLEEMADGFINITVWFITSLPYLLFMAVVILIIVFAIIRPIVRKSAQNGEKRRREYQEFMLRKAAIEKGMPDPIAATQTAESQAAPTQLASSQAAEGQAVDTAQDSPAEGNSQQ